MGSNRQRSISAAAPHTFDARCNTPRIGRVLMVRGRDAADGAMITSFGFHDMKAFRVWTNEFGGEPTVEDLKAHLNTPSQGEPLKLAPTG